jgi:hypothetical protein
MIFKVMVFFILGASLSARADKYVFKADHWKKGLHLLAGGGFNGTIYHSNFERQDQGIGLNFKTQVGYYLNNQWALEVGSTVKFDQVDDLLIWDTLFTGGFRYRFQNFPFTTSRGVYARGFYGRAPTVIFVDDAPDVYRSSKASRIQYDGPVYGLAIGNMYDGAKGKVWYLEYGISFQQLNRFFEITDEEDVPVTLLNEDGENKIKIYSAYVSIGILVF